MDLRKNSRKFRTLFLAFICCVSFGAIGLLFFKKPVNQTTSSVDTNLESAPALVKRAEVVPESIAEPKIAQVVESPRPSPTIEVEPPRRSAKRSIAQEHESESVIPEKTSEQKSAEPQLSSTSKPTPAVTPSTAQAPAPASAPESREGTHPRLDPEFWVWGGIGENYQYYAQNIPSLSGSSTFQNIQGPALYLSAGAQGENLGVEVTHKQAPGKMEAPSGATIKNGEYDWKTLSTEALYKLNDSPWRIRGGFQYHLMPFMVYTPSTRVLEVKSNTLILATLGFDRTFQVSKKLRAEWQLRYQHPVMSGTNSGDEFKVVPKFAFDGSIGTIYNVSDTFRLGLFWYGQYHNYDFSYQTSTNFSGSQTLFYSNVELRAGFEFR